MIGTGLQTPSRRDESVFKLKSRIGVQTQKGQVLYYCMGMFWFKRMCKIQDLILYFWLAPHTRDHRKCLTSTNHFPCESRTKM